MKPSRTKPRSRPPAPARRSAPAAAASPAPARAAAFEGDDDGQGGGPLGQPRLGTPAVPGPLGRVGLGFHPDLPDRRDLVAASEKVRDALTPARHERIFGARRKKLPAAADLREWFPPVDDQGKLSSCTAHAVTGLAEYLYTRGTGERLDVSRLFVYRASRRLLGWTGDTGAYLRTTIKALATFGTPPERLWPYDAARLDEEPDAFTYSYASTFRSLVYARLDPYVRPGETAPDVLDDVRRSVAAGFPVAFGFPVYDSLRTNAPDIPLPGDTDRLVGGHAVLAVGYDDARPVKGGKPGALLIRNSWGSTWGDDGYGYLPYEYVRGQLATDFWTILEQKWIREGQFD